MSSETLGDVAHIVMGQSPPGDSATSDPTGLPLLNGPTEFGPHHPEPVQFTEDVRKRAVKGDLLFCVRGSTTGRMNWADREYAIGRGIAAIRHKQDARVQPFVRAVVEHGLANLLAQATGSTFPNVSFTQLAAVPYPCIDMDQQSAIARVLGAIDDKIEQNRRTVRALEQLSRAMFRAWFVDFEPVKAKASGATAFPSMPQSVFDALPTQFVDSAIGPVPDGWVVGRLGELIEIHDSRRIPLSRRQREERPGPYRYYGAAGIVDYVDDFIFDGVFVLVGEDGTVVGDDDRPTVQYVWGQFWVNNHAHVLTGSGGYSTEHLRLLLDHVNIRPFVTGAVQPKLNQSNLKSVPTVRATHPVVESFGQTIAPAFHLLRVIEDESRRLAEMRDYLLPKLLGQEVRVELHDG